MFAANFNTPWGYCFSKSTIYSVMLSTLWLCSTFNVCNSCVSESTTGMWCVTFFTQFSAGESDIWVDVQLISTSGSTKCKGFALCLISKLSEEIWFLQKCYKPFFFAFLVFIFHKFSWKSVILIFLIMY